MTTLNARSTAPDEQQDGERRNRAEIVAGAAQIRSYPGTIENAIRTGYVLEYVRSFRDPGMVHAVVDLGGATLRLRRSATDRPFDVTFDHLNRMHAEGKLEFLAARPPCCKNGDGCSNDWRGAMNEFDGRRFCEYHAAVILDQSPKNAAKLKTYQPR